MALDEPKESDTTHEQDGIKYLIDNGLSQQCGLVKVDFVDAGARSGFSISSANPIGGGGGCGSSCSTSSGSCGC